jgi:predicted nucleic acid-binding protein
MILLDTNVLSALMRQTPERKIVTWLDEQPRTSVWTTSITVLEIRCGLQITLTGKRRTALLRAFEMVLEKLGDRVVPFDVEAAQHSAELMAARHKSGRAGDLRDAMIAGIVLAQHATLVTRNTPHFQDASIPLINPWTIDS